MLHHQLDVFNASVKVACGEMQKHLRRGKTLGGKGFAQTMAGQLVASIHIPTKEVISETRNSMRSLNLSSLCEQAPGRGQADPTQHSSMDLSGHGQHGPTWGYFQRADFTGTNS